MILAIVLVGLALGSSNLAASFGIGTSGADRSTRVELAIVYGLFESGMPVVGLAVGQHLANGIEQDGRFIGAGLLIAMGLYALARELVARRGAGSSGAGSNVAPQLRARRGRLVLSALALSADNLVVGFALGSTHVGLVVAAVVIGGISVAMSLVGLELGRFAGQRLGNGAELIGSAVLVGVGVAIGAGLL